MQGQGHIRRVTCWWTPRLVELVIDVCQCAGGNSNASVENFHAHESCHAELEPYAAFSRVLDCFEMRFENLSDNDGSECT